ncbi:hypothetical protein HN803_02085 [candidate division WWE3 bacterium]|jgi:hypothetical protein|nr:hypothetical protein [candidate division WWE3 bacterium]MBT7349562.1 hypothetical protein [candidate division WWE3 bacterium]
MKNKNIIVGIFFGLLILVGLFVYKDYGISWDEPIQHKLGVQTYDYVFGQNEQLLKNSDRFYGQHYEFLLIIAEKVFNITDVQMVYQMRHLVNYLFFILGAFFFYLLLRRRLRSVGWGLLGSALLVFSPRIFAHSFYNSKDVVFLTLFIIASYLALVFMEKRNLLFSLIASFVTALLIGIRVMGVVLPILVLDLFSLGGKSRASNKKVFLYLVFTALFTILVWPILWEAPLQNFLEAFNYFPQKTGILFFGEKISSTAVPWYYTLGWILVTTPFSYLVLGLIGLWHVIEDIPKVRRDDLLILGWFALPLVATIVMHSVLHDTWRQMFFIYPPILYFAILGLAKSSPDFRKGLKILLGVNLFFVLTFMVRNHPYQNIYFSEFAKRPYGSEFSLDYWGLSYKQGYEYLASVDSRSEIKVFADGLPGETNLMMLPLEERIRFQFVSNKSSADYYLTTYRGSRELYASPVFYEIVVDGARILGIYKVD